MNNLRIEVLTNNMYFNLHDKYKINKNKINKINLLIMKLNNEILEDTLITKSTQLKTENETIYKLIDDIIIKYT